SFRKIDIFVLHQKLEYSASGTAAVAVVRLLRWVNEERRCFLLVKWADCAELRPSSLEREIVGNNRHDVRGSRYLFNGFLSDPRHNAATIFQPPPTMRTISTVSASPSTVAEKSVRGTAR